MDEFEQQLRETLARQAAPEGFKQRLMERRRAQNSLRRAALWQRLAAALVLCAVLGGAAEWTWHEREERRRGEEAKQQVLTALRITGHALNQMNIQLAGHGRAQQ